MDKKYESLEEKTYDHRHTGVTADDLSQAMCHFIGPIRELLVIEDECTDALEEAYNLVFPLKYCSYDEEGTSEGDRDSDEPADELLVELIAKRVVAEHVWDWVDNLKDLDNEAKHCAKYGIEPWFPETRKAFEGSDKRSRGERRGIFQRHNLSHSAASWRRDSVDLTTRNQWCLSEINTCRTVCDEQNASSSNLCDPDTLEYRCDCVSGWTPPIEYYKNSLPSLMCGRANSNCIAENVGDAVRQKNCTVTIGAFCGDMDPKPGNLSSSSSSLTSSSTTISSHSSSTPTTTPLTTSSKDSPTGSTTNGLPSPNNSAPPSNEEPVTDTGSGGLSTGAKAGIAVGVVVPVAIGVIVFFLFWHRKRQATAAAGIGNKDDEYRKPELDGDATQMSRGGWVPGDRQELEQPPPPELHGYSVPAELDTGTYGGSAVSQQHQHQDVDR
ncbi:hypothetical protein B0H66DRAFT_602185 [Apodospora peruviana]|uniref:DUF7707 domain-containing protein n=1 Tax=Apodospora peruviana TaxID=516989 RepID=A0AAE0ID41_9PEZI|nr:hypothetical protein B0H66DRAFT_602185 [Apodospora peruviana]